MIQRDRHAEFVSALAITASTLDRIATEIRHLARSEVREVQEPFAAGQKGSSAMPHKRNPVVSERVCGLARVIRGYAQVALEDMPLWHERDISHSSAERVILPDATGLLHFMLSDMAWVMDGLHVDPDRMLANLESTGGIFFSQKVLTALVDHGMARDDAYAAVQRAAKDTWERGLRFQERMWEEIADAGVAVRGGVRGAVPGRAVPGEPRRRVRAAGEAPGGGGVSADAVLHARGKVRDVYEVGDRLLIVATDRISAFDAVLPDADPRQGPRAHRACRSSGSIGRPTWWATIW